MKQNITHDDLRQLSENGLTAYKTYLKGKYANAIDYIMGKGDSPVDFSDYPISQLPVLSIGQMIEFLDEHKDLDLGSQIDIDDDEYYNLKAVIWDRKKEPCDVLWTEAKEIFEA